MNTPKILVSACLLGCPARYDGQSKPVNHPLLQRWHANGWLVPPANTEALGTAIIEAVNTPPAQRAQLGAVGRQLILAQYTWPAVVARTIEVYREMLGQDSA